MELQKKKETLWSIKKKDGDDYFRLKSIEEAGVITGVGIGLSKSDKEIFFEMTPLEFKNFFSIIKSFKDLLYSEGIDFMNKQSVDQLQESESDNIVKPSFSENIEDRTVEEIEHLRQIERGSTKKTDITDSEPEPSEKINIDSEVNNLVEKIKDQSIVFEDQKLSKEELFMEMEKMETFENEQDQEINTAEIFKEIDSIIPTVEKGKNLEDHIITDDKSSEFTNEYRENGSKEEKKELDKEKDKEKKLDPTEWDPW